MNFTENIRISLESVRSNWLRAILTLIIIAFGIMALVGILTAIDTAIYSLSSNLSYMGANVFEVEPASQEISSNRGGRQSKRGEPFSFQQAMDFKERYKFPADVSVSFWADGAKTIRYADRKTNPNVSLYGVDEIYLDGKGFDLAYGRNFTTREALNGGLLAIIGSDLVEDLFNGDSERAVGKTISTGELQLKVIGALESKGSSMNANQDRRVLIPLQTAKRFYGADRSNYTIFVSVPDPTKMEAAIGEATIALRNVRGLRAGQENDFEIEKSSGLIDIIKENTVTLRLAAVSIGLMTLLGAAIGLMNIMLVSVTERTREIGIRKAMGATRRNIMLQFLIEAVVITMMGGVLGIILGVLVGNAVTFFIGGSFLFPMLWISIALVVCIGVGLLSGLYPALRAAALDPIESLRYE